MKTKILCGVLAMLPLTANAAIPYRVEQIEMPATASITGEDSQALARVQRFYIGGAYDFSMWNDGTANTVLVSGKNTSSFEVMEPVISLRA